MIMDNIQKRDDGIMCGFTAFRESADGVSRQRRSHAQSRSGAEPLKKQK